MGVSGQCHAPATLYPRGKDPWYPLDRRLVGPRAGLDAGARRKILCPCRGLNPDRPARSQTLYWLSYRDSKITRCSGEFLDLSGMKWQEGWENSKMRSCMVCTFYHILLRWSNQARLDERGMHDAWGRWEMCKQFWLESPRERDYSDDLGVMGI
jgi:hypothetical protein